MVMINHNLHLFLRVAEKGSVSQAAEELYISQPAVSKAIKNLEETLQVKLFHRDKRSGLLLTDIGREILLLARQMADLENRIYQTAYRSNHLIGGNVRIASMPILTSVILSRVLYRFRRQYPAVTVSLMEGSSMEIRRAVEEHRVDLALLSAPFGSLDHEILFQDRMIAVSHDPLAETDAVDLNDRPERFLFCKAGHETMMELLRANHVEPQKSFLVEQAETVLSLADAKNGIGILSELVVDHAGSQLLRYPTRPQIPIDIGMAACDLRDLPPAALVLKQMIADCAKSL